jgi:hypothetical protein
MIPLKSNLKTTLIMNMFMGAILLVAIGHQTGFCQTNVCAVHVDPNGIMTSMTVTNPLTSLQIEKELDFDVDNQGNPTKGMVKFKKSMYYGEVERELKPTELRLMWEQFGGRQEFWNTAQKNDRIISFTNIDRLPKEVFGTRVRLFLNRESSVHSTEFFGTLSLPTDHPERLLINTGGPEPIPIDKLQIREIQTLK